MKTDGNELNDDFLDKVQGGSDKHRYNDLVAGVFPTASALVSIKMVVLHGWEKGNFNSQPPKEQSRWNL